MSNTFRLFPPFGDPWPSCLLPSQFHRLILFLENVNTILTLNMRIGTPPDHEVLLFFFFFRLLFFICRIFISLVGSLLLCWLFSSCSKWGYSSLWCMGLSLHWLFLLQSMGSRVLGLQQLWHVSSVVVPGLQGTGSVVVAHELSCSRACEIFPEKGSNPCLLSLAGGFFTTESLGRPCFVCLFVCFLRKTKITGGYDETSLVFSAS